MIGFWGKHLLMKMIGDLFWRSTRCLFNLSTGRTGTLTMVKLLNLSPEINAFHEPRPVLGEVSKAAYNDIWVQPDKYKPLFVAARRSPIGITGLKGKIYAEHTLMIYLSPMIANELPKAKFMHMYRHPKDVVRSGMRRGWFRGHPWDKYRLEPLQGDTLRGKWDTEWDPFAKICWFWNSVNSFILELQERFGSRRMLSMKFEDFIDIETGAYARPFEFLDVEPPPIDEARKILCVKHNVQTVGDFPQYEYWSEQQRDTFYRITGKTMQQLGYE